MDITHVEINVEELQLSDPSLVMRLNLCKLYLYMAWRGLCGAMSQVKVSPTYGGEFMGAEPPDEPEDSLSDEEREEIARTVDEAFSKVAQK